MRVFFLKTRSSPSDGYEECFTTLVEAPFHYIPSFVPVLEHRFVENHLALLRTCIVNGDFSGDGATARARKYGGLIFTSQRAVEAFARVVHELRGNSVPVDDLLPSSVALYAVGPATARSLRSIDLQCRVLGEESGNGEDLAHFILRHYDDSSSLLKGNPEDRRRLLFLVGEQRRDVIPRVLQGASLPADKRIGVEEMIVYETGEMVSFSQDFEKSLSGGGDEADIRWVVVFSPTGCEAMLRVLEMLDAASGKVTSMVNKQKRRTLIVCIGPTTEDYLIREFDFVPDACAAEPNPQGVLQAIEKYMGSKNIR